MNILLSIYLFVIGAAMGSFAGAVAWRLEKARDFVRERSECEHCHHVLAWYDLVPIVSWLSLKGRCRYCHKPIGVSALLLEIVMASAFVLSFMAWPHGWGVLGVTLFIVWLLALVLLAILFVYDVRHSLLPDVLVWPLTALGVVGFCLIRLAEGMPLIQWPVEAILALLPISGLYGLLYAFSKGRLIGFGDVKLGIPMGLLLGWEGALLALFVANYLGFLWVLPGMLRGKLKTGSRMPFGPFLIAAMFIIFLWGSLLQNWLVEFMLL